MQRLERQVLAGRETRRHGAGEQWPRRRDEERGAGRESAIHRRQPPTLPGRARREWLAAWADDRGGKGTADAVVSYDAKTHELTVTLAATGPILGSGSVPTTTYRVGVDRIALSTSTLEVTSPQLGTVKIDLDARTLHATAIPGHPEIAEVTGALSRGTPTGASGSYQVIGTDGKNHVGSFTVVRGGPRPTSVAAPGAANDLTQFVEGDYAASLLSPAEATQVLGRPADAPIPNGGRFFYVPNINVSDANVKSTDGTVILQYSIFRATTAAIAKDFWEHTLTPGLKTIPGMGADTVYVDNYLESYVWKDREIAEFNFVGNDSASMAPAAVARFAKAIVAHLGPKA